MKLYILFKPTTKYELRYEETCLWGFTFVTMAPQPRGIAGIFTFRLRKPCQKNHCGDSQLVKQPPFSAAVCCVFITLLFFWLNITQIYGISPSLQRQCKSENTAYLHGYLLPLPRGWGGGGGAWLQMTSAYVQVHNVETVLLQIFAFVDC